MVVTVVVLVATLAAVPDAAAAPTWLPAGTVAPATATGEAGAVDLDAAGNAVAVWTQTTGGEPQVVASSRPAGGSWGAPVSLSAPGSRAMHPQVVLGGDGRATAVWFRATGPATYGLQSSTRSVQGGWTAPVELPGDTSAAAEAALVLRPGASVVVAWPRTVGGLWSLSASLRTPTGSWSTPVDLSSGSPVMPGRPRLAVDGNIVTTALWSVSDGARWTVRAASAPLAGTWSAPVTVSSSDQDAVDPDLAVAGDGYAVAVWARWNAVAGNGATMAVWSRWNGADRWVAQASTRPAQQTGWSGPADLSTAGFSVDGVEVSTNTFGSRFVATWTATPASGPSVVQAAVQQEGGWRPAVTLSDPTAASSHPTAVVSATNPATVTWLGSNGAASAVRGAVLPAYASAFEPATSLSSPDREAGPPQMAVNRGGDVLVLWGETGPASFQPRYAAYDAAGPVVRTFHLAGHAVAGHPATYDATALDAWSPLAAYAWSFGDGSKATGPATTHAFAVPGKYTVRFTVTDAVGNSTVRVARTKVIAAPEITTYTLAKRRISLADKVRIRIGLNVPAKVKLVLRSKERHRVDGVLHRQKLVLRRELDAGRSTVVLKGSRLLADTWVVTATARTLGVDSTTVKKRLVVVRP
jgi:hypothetical protein